MKISFVFLALGALTFAVGCSETDNTGGSESEVTAAKVMAGSFKLYREPAANPNPSCDIFTSLELTSDGKAHVEERLGGACEIYVDPNPRDYELLSGESSCGSHVFMGRVNKGLEVWSITITDHRTRLCEDVVPARLVVEEKVIGKEGGGTTTLYSQDQAPDVVVEGELTRVMGIGGESTGFAIKGANGLHELVLENGEKAQFVEGKRARVKGTMSTVDLDRRSVDVNEMLVCPDSGTTINCMPGPHQKPLCSGDAGAWIAKNCEGVDFTH